MTLSSKLFITVSALIATICGAMWIPAVQDRVFVAAVKHVFAKRVELGTLFEDDAMRILVCGSSAPLPDRERAKACIIVIAGGRYYLVDIGPEAVKNLGLWFFPLERVGGVFLTHLHSDHIGELGEFNLESWVQGRQAPLDVYGPPGVEQVVAGFSQAYALDAAYRTAHHGPAFLPPERGPMVAHTVAMPGPDLDKRDRTTGAFEAGGLKVTAFEVNHHEVKPAYGYRFDYKGRSVVISGDTAYHPPLAAVAKGANVLFHEADAMHLFELMREAGKGIPGLERFNEIHLGVNSYHSSPVQAAQIANQANVKLLVMYHLMPPLVSSLEEPLWMRGVSKVRADGVMLAHDGSLITLRLGTDQIDIGTIE